MNKSKTLQYLLQLTLFVAAFGLILVIIQWTRAGQSPAATQDAAAGMAGLSRGEVITLPELPRLNGGTVSLGKLREKNLLVGLFSTSCPGCSKDTKFWKSLQAEAARRNVAFYLIAIDKEQEGVERYAKAYGFDDLPVLVDASGAVAKAFEVSVVPQYVLLNSQGQVRERWNGLSHTNVDDKHAKEPAQFFANL